MLLQRRPEKNNQIHIISIKKFALQQISKACLQELFWDNVAFSLSLTSNEIKPFYGCCKTAKDRVCRSIAATKIKTKILHLNFLPL